MTYDCTVSTVKRAITNITLKVHSRDINEVKQVKAYIQLEYREKQNIWSKNKLMFQTCNYISVSENEVLLHLRFICGNTDEIGLHNKENKDILEQKHLISQIYGIPIHHFLYNIIIQKQHQNSEEEGRGESKKTVSCKYLKISLSKSYKLC